MPYLRIREPLVLNTAIVVLKNNVDGSANLLIEYNQSKIEVRGFKLKNGFTGKNPEYEMKYDELTSTLSITGNDGRFQLTGRNQNSAGADSTCEVYNEWGQCVQYS